MLNFIKNRSLYEAAFVVVVTLAFGLGIGMLGALAPKFQIALGIGLFGVLVICLTPAKRALCLFLWVLIQPLSVEKILYTAPPLWESLRGQEIVMNAGDVILIFLAGILFIESFKKHKSVWVWNKTAALFFAVVLWAITSYLIHLLFYRSDFVLSAPIGILHFFRLLLFVVITLSAIQTRADLIWVLIATMVILIFESILVFLSFATGQPYNFSRLLGMTATIQSYNGADGAMTRASGTLGVANQQALFHAMFTFMLIGLWAAKNALLRNAALLTMLLSFTAVIFTFARTSWMCIGLASILVVAIFIKRKEVTPRSWLMGGVVFIAFTVVLAALAQPVIDRLTSGDNGATDSRLRMIALANDLFLQYPIIGVGPAGYPEAGLKLYPPGYKETEWVPLGEQPIVPPLGRVELATAVIPGAETVIVPLSVHNKYLLMLSELGIVGLVLWLMIIYQFFKQAKECSRYKDPLLRYTGVAGMAIVLVASLYMMLDLFTDEKTLEVLLFPMLVIVAANKIGRNQILKPAQA